MPEIYQNLVAAGTPMLRRVTLVPGSTVALSVEALQAAPFLTGSIDRVPPEGMLAPETYEVQPGEDRNRK